MSELGRDAAAAAPVEIACDESGFTGGNLTFPATVFAHAGVLVSRSAAESEMERLRRRVVAHGELKASWLLRWCRPDDLRRLLGRGGVLDDARVHLSDTRWSLLLRLADVVVGPDEIRGIDLPGRSPAARETAAVLHRLGPSAYGAADWQRFLTRSGHLLRSPSRWIPASAPTDFEELLDELGARPAPAPLRSALQRLREGLPRAAAARRDLQNDPRRSPLLEPLLPAVANAARSWGAEHPDLRLCHDEQSALTPWRIDEIARRVAADRPGHTLAVERVDSRGDARVQLADLVAGISRRAATGLLTGDPDPGLLGLVAPLVSDHSVWSDGTWRTDQRTVVGG